MKEKILVVGGTGFIGRHLLNKISKKKYKIYSLSKKKIKKKDKVKNVQYLFCDIKSYSNLKKTLKTNFDHIINLSGYVNHSKKRENILCHYNGTKNLVNFFKNNHIHTFIQVGSSLEYGNFKSPQTENLICNPRGIYGNSKLKASKYVINAGKKFNFPFIILRPYQVYGPNQKQDRLIPQTISSCLHNKKFECTNGKQLRDFIYIDDFTKLIEKILINKKQRRKIYNVGSGSPITVKSVITRIQKIIKQGQPLFGSIKMRKDETKSLYPSIKKVCKDFKWKPEKKINYGLKKTISFYKNF